MKTKIIALTALIASLEQQVSYMTNLFESMRAQSR